MNKIKNTMLIIITAILITFLIGIISYYTEAEESPITANDYNIDKIKMSSKFKYNLTDLSAGRKRGNLFCVEHKQQMSQWHDVNYNVANIVTIDGKKAKAFKKDKKTTKESDPNEWNAKLAAAIYYSKAGEASDYNTNQRQKAIWYYLYKWVENIGDEFYKIDTSIVGPNNEGLSKKVKTRVNNYVKKLNKENDAGKDAYITDKKEKDSINYVGLESVNNNSYIKIGYFNLDFEPDLESITVKGTTADNTTEHAISGIKFSQNNEIVSVGKIDSNVDFSILIPVSANATKITKVTFKTETTQTTDGEINAKVVLLETTSKNSEWQNLCFVKANRDKTDTTNAEKTKTINVDLRGCLQIKKYCLDTNTYIPNVPFVLRYGEKYVYQDANKNISYSDNGPGTVFHTDQSGSIIVENLLPGTYKPEEQVFRGYIDQDPSQTIVVTAGSTAQNPCVITKNNRQYVTITGYVWNDGEIGKDSNLDDLSINNARIGDVTVRLWKNDRTQMGVTKTDGEGYYTFSNIPVNELGSIYVDFYYDGIKYTTVQQKTYNEKGEFIDVGSKGIENAGLRENLNNKFGNITNNGLGQNSININNGVTNDTLGYSRDTANHKSTVSYAGIDTTVWARAGAWRGLEGADSVWLSLCNDFSLKERLDQLKVTNPSADRIDDVNLGLKVREKPNMSVLKDIERVKLSINGYNHIYNYDTRYQKYGNNPGGLNVGVKFGNEYGSMAYTRPIYKSDYTYENPKDRSKELQVYITYKIMIYNNTTTLYERN